MPPAAMLRQVRRNASTNHSRQQNVFERVYPDPEPILYTKLNLNKASVSQSHDNLFQTPPSKIKRPAKQLTKPLDPTMQAELFVSHRSHYSSGDDFSQNPDGSLLLHNESWLRRKNLKPFLYTNNVIKVDTTPYKSHNPGVAKSSSESRLSSGIVL